MNSRRSERVSEALLLLKNGEPMSEIAARLRNFARRGDECGLGEHAAELIVRSGLRSLAMHVLLDRRPAGLPDELWPPEAVREVIRSAPLGIAGRGSIKVLRAWVEGKDVREALHDHYKS